MVIAQYFVEFIFYSFLGWCWESIYCTIKNKKWADRGFLFGPVCPIYGSCVVAAQIVFTQIPVLSTGETPMWQIFLICMVGSAIAEFATSWVLEKRFHAMWWDYSEMPLNIQGRICLPVSVGFGLAGIVVVKYLIPLISGMHTDVNPIVYEVLMLVFALVFGADFALTEASLSALLQSIEEYKEEFNRKAETTYENIVSMPKRLEEGAENAKVRMAEGAANAKASAAEGVAGVKTAIGEGVSNAKAAMEESVANVKAHIEEGTAGSGASMTEETENKRVHVGVHELADRYVGRMDFNQRRILGNMERFKPVLSRNEKNPGDNASNENRKEGKKIIPISPAEHLKEALENRRKKKAS